MRIIYRRNDIINRLINIGKIGKIFVESRNTFYFKKIRIHILLYCCFILELAIMYFTLATFCLNVWNAGAELHLYDASENRLIPGR